jgi:hypothetical protein
MAVNLTGFVPRPVYDGGYYLFATQRVTSERVGVVQAVREQNRIDYARAHPPHWRKVLSAFIE